MVYMPMLCRFRYGNFHSLKTYLPSHLIIYQSLQPDASSTFTLLHFRSGHDARKSTDQCSNGRADPFICNVAACARRCIDAARHQFFFGQSTRSFLRSTLRTCLALVLPNTYWPFAPLSSCLRRQTPAFFIVLNARIRNRLQYSKKILWNMHLCRFL